MRELDDKEFDQIFKSRITEEVPEFDEDSWRKMEEKLRKKDRKIMFFRIAAVALLVLTLGISLYSYNAWQIDAHKNVGKKNNGQDRLRKNIPQFSIPENLTPSSSGEHSDKVMEPQQSANNALKKPKPAIAQRSNFPNHYQTTLQTTQNQPPNATVDAKNEAINTTINNSPITLSANSDQSPTNIIAQGDQPVQIVEEKSDPYKKVKKPNHKLPISLAISAGPDFNSTSSLIGGKTNLAFAMGIGVGITKKISVQTGIGYGHKNYKADPYDYTFNNPNTVYTVESIKAACKVVEIPLNVSYKLSEKKKRSIAINGGLSSYLMLKEDYIYTYYQNLNKPDRLVEATNENKHILSVVNLSASYDINLKDKKLGLGIEPYVKIPLTGIGLGNVPLKSSGVSLKLRYDFNKN